MQAYRIVNWQKSYEIKTDKRAADADTPVDKLRRKKHDYIRWKVYGHNLSAKWRKLVKKAWRPGRIFELGVLGLFGKLLEIAGSWENPLLRGWILDEDARPMEAAEIAELLAVAEMGLVREAMGLLTDLGWVEKCEFPPELQNLQGAAKIAGVGGNNCNPFGNEPKSKERSLKTSEFCPPSASDFGSASATITRADAQQRVCTILQVAADNQSDQTTIDDIFNQIRCRAESAELAALVFAKVVERARGCQSARRPIAAFVAAMEKGFGYKPVGRGSRSIKEVMAAFAGGFKPKP